MQRTGCPSISKVRTVAGPGGEFMRLSQSSYRLQVHLIDRAKGLHGHGHTDLGKLARILDRGN